MDYRRITLVVTGFLILAIAIVAARFVLPGRPKLFPLASRTDQIETPPTTPPAYRPRAPKSSPPAESSEEEITTLLESGARHIHDHNFEDAARAYVEALRLNSDNETALVELGILYAHDPSRQEEAEGMLRKALSKNPENEIALEELIYIQESSGKSDEAMHTLKDLYEKNPSSPVLSAVYGRALARQGSYRQAIDFLKRSAKTPTLAQSSLISLTDVYRRMNDSRNLAETYSELVAIQERSLQEGNQEGQPSEQMELDLTLNKVAWVDALFASKQSERAEKLLRSLLETNPENPAVKSLAARWQGHQTR